MKQGVFNYVFPESKHPTRNVRLAINTQNMRDYLANGFDEVIFNLTFTGDTFISEKAVSGKVLVTDADGIVRHYSLELTDRKKVDDFESP